MTKAIELSEQELMQVIGGDNSYRGFYKFGKFMRGICNVTFCATPVH